MQKETRIALLCLVSVGIVICGIALLIALAKNNPFIPYDDKEFDQALWKSYTPDDYLADSPRLPMAADLQQNYIKPGMTRDQIVKLLGEPGNHSEEVYIYGLGKSDGLWPRLYFLDVYFDSSEKVVEARITWD